MRPLAVLFLLAPVALLGGQPAPSYAAAPLCQGQAPTIVGAPGSPVVGTAGDDVIVSEGATDVDALAGNDLVCVTLDAYTTHVEAGLGDDVVDSTGGESTVHAFLGDGADTFVGGDQEDHVYARAPRRRSTTSRPVAARTSRPSAAAVCPRLTSWTWARGTTPSASRGCRDRAR